MRRGGGAAAALATARDARRARRRDAAIEGGSRGRGARARASRLGRGPRGRGRGSGRGDAGAVARTGRARGGTRRASSSTPPWPCCTRLGRVVRDDEPRRPRADAPRARRALVRKPACARSAPLLALRRNSATASRPARAANDIVSTRKGGRTKVRERTSAKRVRDFARAASVWAQRASTAAAWRESLFSAELA